MQLVLFYFLLIGWCYGDALSTNRSTNQIVALLTNEVFTMKNVRSDKINVQNNSDDDMVVINTSQFVAKIKGGLANARLVADKLNLKLIQQVCI